MLAGTGQLTQAACKKLLPGWVQEEEDGQPMQWLWAGMPVVWQIEMLSVRPLLCWALAEYRRNQEQKLLSGGGKRSGSHPS